MNVRVSRRYWIKTTIKATKQKHLPLPEVRQECCHDLERRVSLYNEIFHRD